VLQTFGWFIVVFLELVLDRKNTFLNFENFVIFYRRVLSEMFSLVCFQAYSVAIFSTLDGSIFLLKSNSSNNPLGIAQNHLANQQTQGKSLKKIESGTQGVIRN